MRVGLWVLFGVALVLNYQMWSREAALSGAAGAPAGTQNKVALGNSAPTAGDSERQSPRRQRVSQRFGQRDPNGSGAAATSASDPVTTVGGALAQGNARLPGPRHGRARASPTCSI